jgi:hypothetical protein
MSFEELRLPANANHHQDGRLVAMFAYDEAVAERYPTIRA